MNEVEEFFDKVGTALKPKPRPKPAAEPSPSRGLAATPDLGGGDGAQQRWAGSLSTFWASASTYDQLPSGLYRCDNSPNLGPVLLKSIIDTDDLVELPDSASIEVVAEIQRFWTLDAEFRARGFIHKRGVLLYGPPGSGKTATLQQLIRVIVQEHEGVGIYIDHPTTAAACLQMVRRIEPVRPIIALLEDLDALVERFGENEYLAMLDGEAQVANIVFVATTNYPERLDRRFVDRPSRFDAVRFVGMPSAAARRAYLLAKEPSLAVGDEIDEWVRESDGLSVAHLREMIVLCRCYQKPLAEALRRLNKMRERTPSSDQFGSGPAVGFAAR